MPGVWPAREASRDAGGLNLEHMESNLCLEAPGKRISWELATVLLPLPRAFFFFCSGRRPKRSWGENNKAPRRMRRMTCSPPPLVKPHLYPCPLNTPGTVVVCDSEWWLAPPFPPEGALRSYVDGVRRRRRGRARALVTCSPVVYGGV